MNVEQALLNLTEEVTRLQEIVLELGNSETQKEQIAMRESAIAMALRSLVAELAARLEVPEKRIDSVIEARIEHFHGKLLCAADGVDSSLAAQLDERDPHAVSDGEQYPPLFSDTPPEA